MKTSRRAFLANASLTSACMSIGASVPWPAQAMPRPATPSGEHAAFDHTGGTLTIVFDEHLADSRAFAVRSRAMGARIVPLGNDVGMLWFERLMPLANSPLNMIAGLTTHAHAFLLTRFAQSIGSRVLQRASEAYAGPDRAVMWRLVAANAAAGTQLDTSSQLARANATRVISSENLTALR